MEKIIVKNNENQNRKMVFHVLVYSDDKNKILIKSRFNDKYGYIELVEDPQVLYDLTEKGTIRKGELYKIQYVEA